MNAPRPSLMARLFAGKELEHFERQLLDLDRERGRLASSLAEAHNRHAAQDAAAQADLDEAKRQIQALTSEREGLRGFASAVHEAYATIEFDLGGHVLGANEAFLALMGYDREEVVGRHHRLFVDPVETASPDYVRFWADLNAGRSFSQVFRRLTKSGREVWIQAVYAPLKDADGAVRKIVKVATDVTQARLQAADHEGQIQAIGKAQAVIEFALDGRILHANDNFLGALGYSLAEIKGQHHSMFVEPDFRNSVDYRLFWDKLGRGEFDADAGGGVERDRVLASIKVAVAHVGHVRLRLPGPGAELVRVLPGELLHRERGAAVGVPFTQHRVHRTPQDLRKAQLQRLLLVARRRFRIVGNGIAVRLQLGDGLLQLRDRRRDVGELDDVRFGRRGQLAQGGEVVRDALLGGEVVREVGNDAPGQ